MDQTTEQGSSTAIWYVVGVIVIVALAFWYFYDKKTPSANTESTAVEQTQIQEQSSGNTTADISADLNQIPDSSAGLDADASAASSDLQAI